MTSDGLPSADQPHRFPAAGGWRLLTSPMSEEQARRAAALIEQELAPVNAIPADPRKNLVLAWDRWTVEMIREALVRLAEAGASVPAQLVANLGEWLAEADPYSDDEPAWRSTP